MERIDLLALDCHGIVLNNPFRGFLEDCDRADPGRGVLPAWRRELRAGAWLGTLSDAELWQALRREPYRVDSWQRELEPRYAPGPAAAALPRWSRQVSVWMLSNHRTDWLLPRLARFELEHHFERILVSDELGAMKPDAPAFELLARAGEGRRVVFVDNAGRNIEAAERAGLECVLAEPASDWVAEVDRLLGCGGVS